MKINRSNYETYFLDFHEGNLSEALTRELFSFLDSNPDLKEEFESFEIVSVIPSSKKFFDKDRLKKDTITQYNYKTWFVAYIENDLTTEQQNEVEQFLQKNPSLKPELEIFKQTKLVPDHKIIFENKKQLKHGGKIIPLTPQVYRIAVAASVVLLLITYFLLRNNNMKDVAHREIPKSEIRKENSALPPEKKSHADKLNKNEMKKHEHINEGKNRIEKVNQEPKKNTVQENKTDEPLLTNKEEPVHQNSMEKKDSSENLLAENKIGKQPFKPNGAQLSKVFSDDELKELGITSNVQQKEKAGLWDIASKSVNEISKVTGTQISLKKNTDEIEDTKTYALALGKFSVSHTSGK
jgi:hypothetical protein